MPFLPLRDENPLRVIPFQAITVSIIAVCVLVFLWQISLPPREQQAIAYSLGAIPAVILGTAELPPELVMVPEIFTWITAMFLHGGVMHLGGNMLYLWVFGDNIEDSMGHLRFIVFYLLCGVVATAAQALADPTSTVPTIGASGAISGVLGGYLVLHPQVRVLVLVLFRIPIHLPAFIVLGGWIGLQLLNAAIDTGGEGGGGVAWWAHIGGFLAGMVLIVFFRRRTVPLFDRGVRHGPWNRRH
mgnify:CR=1 FL=1|tara:strand:- start:223 stop:951 length:729 start_codon:yes stop_codon:yes gene_type:complete